MNDLRLRLKAEALRLGFSHCGVTTAEDLDESAQERFAKWLSYGFHAGMDYLAREPMRRARPRDLLPGAKSIVCVAARYAARSAQAPDAPPERGWGRVARYARGRDYHQVLAGPLAELEAWLRREGGPNVQTRRHCDAGPLLERQFAQRAGLGFLGKNTLLIARGAGSWLLLAAIVTTLEIDSDEPGTGTCGRCTRCLDACPTGALLAPNALAPGVLDARRCISYLTIEKKGEFAGEEARAIGDWVFGCDICQEVCPYNKAGAGASFADLAETRYPGGRLRLIDLLECKSNKAFERAFADSPLLRPRLKGLRRNASGVVANQGIE